MDWKDAKDELERIVAGTPSSGEESGLGAQSLRLIVEQLDHLHKEGVRFETELEELASRLASLEARVHEDVE